ncbi:Hint domain-containing protein [Roseobacter sp. AzwK-3b]|uniref:Hint domain-containing protein n=1 Tax=Roseobacter sp. AzwK-3b TaxID=351016 RepID=UPI00055A147F|nr:Hint domain-containing protein [Roseobacter sp. AzwK-3b]
MVAPARLPIDTNASAVAMAQEIFGDGATVVSASYTGAALSSGIYTDGDTITPGVTPADTGVILSTGNVTSFTNDAPPAFAWWLQNNSNQSTGTSTNTTGPDNDPLFNAAAGASTFDAAYLDVDFIPTGPLMSMKFVFASEEFPEFQTGIYQDFVGVWVNGQQVDLSIGDGDADPNNLNGTTNANLYNDNTGDQFNTEMDGFTVTLTMTFPVTAGELNSIRIGIADVVDSSYDSALLIAADSLQTTLVAVDDTSNLFPDGSKTLDLLANDVNSTGGTLTITHINGQAVSVGDVVTLTTGQQVMLNANGTVTVTGDGDVEQFNFTYEAASSTGQSDIGFVTVDSVPCFTAGTRILTPSGLIQVECLNPGDLVTTKDDGPQPLRWIGQRRVAAEGSFAPILIPAGSFGAHHDLLVSPLHRVLIRDSLAELLFGEGEVLVAARDLVNGHSIRRMEGGFVDYLHLMFDRHQVIFSEGLETESFLPGPQITNVFEAEVLKEICAIFPEIDPATGAGYSPAARRTLRPFEAQVLVRRKAA